MKHFIYCALTIGLVTLNSCQKEEDVKCILPSTTLTTNSPAITGGSIFLKTPDYRYENDVTFEWRGPNNFFSTEQNPIIPNVTSNMKGEYSLVIKKGICASEILTSSVDVITNTVNCVQSDDYTSFTNGVGSYSLYSFSANPIANNKYEISGGAYSMDINVIFDTDNVPVQGIYTIVNKATALSKGKVHVNMIRSGQFNYYALSGNVLLTYNAQGMPTIKFCSVPFAYSTNSSSDTEGTVKFTVKR